MTELNRPPEVKQPHQRHILQFWNELGSDQQARLSQQVQQIDWKLVDAFVPDSNVSQQPAVDIRSIAPPTSVVRKPKDAAEIQYWHESRQIGEQALKAGKVAAILLAGGQGTRLGFPHPKGTFPIGAVSGKSLFALLAEQIIALVERFGRPIPYLVMTSDGTHDETIDFFTKHNYFGLNRNDVFFFQQGYAPSLDAKTGQLLMSEKGVVSMNPDGHGGLLAALLKADLFAEMGRRGIEFLFSHQVDNPLAKVCDPEFLGMHIRHRAEVSTKVVAKTGPDEKVGVAVSANGRTSIVEYSDLPIEVAHQRDAKGELLYWAGSTAIHLFDRSFLERVATSEASLPWHRALKKIPHIDQHGTCVQPVQENGIKYERFLFDTLPLASTALIVETVRDEEFAPLKNQSGDFSAKYVRHHMNQLAHRWLKAAGVTVPEQTVVEISPRFARTAEDLVARKSELQSACFDRPVYLDVGPLHSAQTGKQEHQPSSSSTTSSMADPIVFDSYYRPQIWGGRGIKDKFGRELPTDGPYGEAWELSTQTLHVSRVIEGALRGRDLNDLWANSRAELANRSGPAQFPLLVKWLECHEMLSLQVHPDDAMAQRVHNEPYGKSEAWIVVGVESTARVYAGFLPGVTRADVVAHLAKGTLEKCLHSFVPKVGDCISLAAGAVHGAGGGLMIAEVQQSSDATYRLYDWNRVGLDGKPRALHIENALDAIDWNRGPVSPVVPSKLPASAKDVLAERLVDGPAIRLERYSVTTQMSCPHAGEMTIWMVLEGSGLLSNPSTGYRREFKQGQTVTLPAAATGLNWQTTKSGQQLKLLCARLPIAN